MNKFEIYACGSIFSSYPDDLSFEDIKKMCLDDDAREKFNDALEDTDNEDQRFCLCEQYEYEFWENIPDMLDEIKDSVERTFGENK